MYKCMLRHLVERLGYKLVQLMLCLLLLLLKAKVFIAVPNIHTLGQGDLPSLRGWGGGGYDNCSYTGITNYSFGQSFLEGIHSVPCFFILVVVWKMKMCELGVIFSFSFMESYRNCQTQQYSVCLVHDRHSCCLFHTVPHTDHWQRSHAKKWSNVPIKKVKKTVLQHMYFF